MYLRAVVVSRRSVLLAPLALGLAACAPPPDLKRLRLGFFPNLTHALALVGVEKGLFAAELGRVGLELETFTFNAGPAAIEALLSGALDATYVGPNPAVNAFVRSRGEAVRIVAGAAVGGAALVVRKGIARAEDLRGQKVATPQLGGTQDVALRTWLKEHGLETDAFGGGAVSVAPQENAQALEALRGGAIAGAWVPEPWASRLVLEGGGEVLVDERTLWPEGRFVTTVLLVRSDLLARREGVVALLRGQLAAERWIAGDPAGAKEVAQAAMTRLTGKALAPAVIARAWEGLRFSSEILDEPLMKAARDAEALGLVHLAGADLAQIFAPEPLAAARAG